MLLCVCLWVCILCVKECVFLRSLCQCVCSSNTGFSPYYPPPPPLFSLFTFDGYTPTPSQFHTKPYLFIFPLFLNSYLFLHSTCLVPHQLLTTFIHLSIHESIHSLIHHIWFPPPNFLHQPFSTFPLLLISGLSLFPFSSSLTLSTSFSSSLPPFLSLFHTVLCASLSLAGLLLGGWEFVCTQVPAEHPLHPGSQPGSASLLLILLLLLLSLPFFPHHLLTLHFYSPTPHDFSYHLGAYSTLTPLPSYLLTFHCPSLPVGSSLLSGYSLVSPQALSAWKRIVTLN